MVKFYASLFLGVLLFFPVNSFLSQKQLLNGNRTLQLNTSHLKPGSYIIKTTGDTTLSSELIIKE